MSLSDGPVRLFSATQVRRLTGLSAHQLSYWDQTGFFSPAHAGAVGERFGRVYSFEDVVGLRVIAILRQDVPLQELRKVGAWLSDHIGSWAGRRFWRRGKRVYWDADEGVRIGTRQPTQGEMPFEMDKITEDMQQAIAGLRQRREDQKGRIERQRFVAGNAFTVAGTRIPAKTVVRLHEAGYSHAAIRREYPQLTNRDIDAALATEARQRAS